MTKRFDVLLLCALSALPAANAAAAPAPASATATAEQRLDHISIQSIGSGPAVVLIPGLSSPREVWEGTTPELAKNHRVLLVQVNGFAGDDPGQNLKEGVLDGIVADLHSYLAAQKLGPAAVVGHSMGGLLGLMLASRHPADVRRLMVVDAFPFSGVMFDPSATVETARPIAAMLKQRMLAGYEGAAGEAAAAATAKGLTAKPESAALVKKWVLRANPKVAAQAMAENLATDMRPALKSITAPIVVLHPAEAAGHDAAATATFYRAQYTGAPQLELVSIPDSAHFLMLDQPERFATELKQFLK